MERDTSRFGYTIFCVDIRVEANGKAIFIGVYTGSLIVQAFPHDLRLVIASHFYAYFDDPLKLLKYRVYKDADVLTEAVTDEPQLADLFQNVPEMPASDRKLYYDESKLPPGDLPPRRYTRFVTTVAVQSSLDRPCVIRVRYETERGLIPAGALIINTPEVSQ